MNRQLAAGHVGAKERDWAVHGAAVRDGIWRTIGSVEILKCVQLNGTTKDVPVKSQCLASCAREVDVWRRSGHSSKGNRVGPDSPARQ